MLIHLLRDINDEMLRHPYDEGLKSIGCRFSEVLSSIVATIDVHGLKKRHLNKHKNAAQRFVNWVELTECISRAATKIRNRIVKYRHMLFTFLEHDNVAWHNNNAEHAMKTFARYRRFSDGRFTARSLQEFLTILTVYQTCEFGDKPFLEMLLSWRREGSECSGIVHEAQPMLLPGYEEIKPS